MFYRHKISKLVIFFLKNIFILTLLDEIVLTFNTSTN